MIEIGRYKIVFGNYFWMQTDKPFSARRFLFFFWVLKEANPDEIDTKPQFPLGTKMMHEGKMYWYVKMEKPTRKSELIKEN